MGMQNTFDFAILMYHRKDQVRYMNNREAYFLNWQKNNPYYKKRISILGDSISTLAGYTKLIFYPAH